MEKLKRDILELVDGETYVYALICNNTYWCNGIKESESISGLYLHRELAEKDCHKNNKSAQEVYKGGYDTEYFSVVRFYLNFKEISKDKDIKYNIATCKILPLLLQTEIYLIKLEFYDSCLEKIIFLNEHDAISHCKMLQIKHDLKNPKTPNSLAVRSKYKVRSLVLNKSEIYF